MFPAAAAVRPGPSRRPALATTRTSRRKRIAVLSAASVLLGGGAAFAYWTTTGTGTGTATSSQPGAVVVNQTSPISNLNPGRPAQTLSGNFDNPGPGTAYVTSVTVSIASVTKAVGAAAGTCDASDYTLTNATMAVGADVVQATGTGTWSGATIAFNNKATAQDQCKGATVNLAYTSN